jgi:hypothetical protein
LAGSPDAFVTKLNPTGSGLVYSTYLGGSGNEGGTFNLAGIAVDTLGHAYVTYHTNSANFPVTAGAFQPGFGGGIDAFVTKLKADGSALVYSTYLGGNGEDAGFDITLDVNNNAYMVGGTASADYPTTTGAFQPTFGGGVHDPFVANSQDAFVAKIEFFIPVMIDIKPGSFPNSINLGSSGAVPVAILGSATFDATQIDPLTVTLADAAVKLKGKGTPMASLEDVNGDSFLDLVVHVSTEALQLTETDTEVVLEGQTYTGQAIQGTDSIRVVP